MKSVWLKLTMVFRCLHCCIGSPGLTLTKGHRLSGLKSSTCLTILVARSRSPRCWQGWFLLRPLSLANGWSSSPCVFTWFPPLYRLGPNLSILGTPGPTVMTTFYFNFLFKDPFSEYNHNLRLALHSRGQDFSL